MRKLLTISILVLIASCDHQHWYSCTFDHMPGLYEVSDHDLEKTGEIVFTQKGGRRYALKREYLIACVALGQLDSGPEKE